MLQLKERERERERHYNILFQHGQSDFKGYSPFIFFSIMPFIMRVEACVLFFADLFGDLYQF